MAGLGAVNIKVKTGGEEGGTTEGGEDTHKRILVLSLHMML